MCLGVPGQITEITDAQRSLATVEISGVRREVSLACVANRPLNELVGQWALIHVGFAMSIIDEDEAAETLRLLQDLGEIQAELDAIAESAVQLGNAI